MAATERGPQAVDAGACDRCADRPRLLPTCGPAGWPGLCQGCALEIGPHAWCDGHQDEAEAALAWAAALPPYLDTVVTLWWIATGEVRHHEVRNEDVARLPAPVRAAWDGEAS